jgi:hypothetical protein
MRRMAGVAVLAAALGFGVAAPALADGKDVTPLGGKLRTSPCQLPPSDNYGHATWSTGANGHATSGRWALHALVTCSRPEVAVTVRTQMLQNGKALGPAYAGACHATLNHPTCSHAAAAGTFTYSHMSGVWTEQWTMTIKGADALPMVVTEAGFCGYNPSAQVVTCTYTSQPTRIP